MASSSVQGRRLSMWWSSDQRKMDFICRTLFLSVSNSVLVTQIKIIRSIRLTDTLEHIQTFYGVGKIDATT